MLVQRDDELEAVQRHLAAAIGGEGGVLVFEGPAGIGKTVLLRAARKRAADAGLAVLQASGGELERAAAWAVARELLQPAVARLEPDVRDVVLQGPAADSAAILGSSPAEDREDPDQAFRVAHALTWVVVGLSEQRPLLLVVDDAHWADAASLRWLLFLARRLEGVSVLVIVATRPAQPSTEHALEALLTCATVLRPCPLGVEAVAEVVSARLGRPSETEFAHACYQVSGGNPYLLNELLHEAIADGLEPVSEASDSVRNLRPASVRRAIVLRLARLDPAALEVARAVVILGDGAAPSTAGALAELPVREVAGAADRLMSTGILADDPQLRFAHPLLRAAVYDDIPAARRALDHRRAARLLAERGGSAAAVGGQLVSAERTGDAWVVERLMEASRSARLEGAPEVARELAARALAEPPADDQRATVLEQLGTAELDLSDSSGVPHLREALDAAPSAEHRGRVALRLARALHDRGHYSQGTRVLEAALDGLSPEAQPELYRSLEGQLVLAATSDPKTVEIARQRIGMALARRGADRSRGWIGVSSHSWQPLPWRKARYRKGWDWPGRCWRSLRHRRRERLSPRSTHFGRCSAPTSSRSAS
jgi:AAA ATPase-like protein